ncbi:MAG: CxxxxCH/CxxCH domain-containing protein [Deltaproteobacteria bacterium]|nr:MAG: CxxxxCH/CxxCH domain-containing protein [Deltaproteobacteria bacterium]
MRTVEGFVLAGFVALCISACGYDKMADGFEGSATCKSCHGNEDSPAPPLALDGSTDTSALGVGAHRRHLVGGNVRSGISCKECHKVPESIDAEGHIDPLPAEVVFGPLASQDTLLRGGTGGTPEWDRQSARCSNVYCHGAALPGGADKEPKWTVVDGSQIRCGSCHGDPPPAPHPQSANCSACHPGTVRPDGRIDIEGGLHIDGRLQVGQLGCDSCHGQNGDANPPPDTRGNTDTSARGVGAHASHLSESDWHAPVECGSCHVVPQSISDEGHIDSEQPADVVFSGLAVSDGASPSYDPENLSCSGTYCHGSTLFKGGSNTVPIWNVVDGSQAACGTCHGLPPDSPHPQSQSCYMCHGEVIDSDGNFTPEKHIDGQVEVSSPHPDGWANGQVHGPEFEQGPAACQACHGEQLDGGEAGVSCEQCHPGFRTNCVFCHGGVDNQTGAPPESVAGELDTSVRGVGAHTAHLKESPAWHAPLQCSDCHDVPDDALSPGHIDPRPAELSFSRIAVADGASPSFDGQKCSSVYCHGATLDAGGSNTEPAWTGGSGEAACGSCHSLPPPEPHPQVTNCGLCHGMVYGNGGFVAPELHIDGIVEVSFTGACDGCHGAPPDTGAHRVHFGAGADKAHYGGTGTAQQLAPGAGAYAFDCGNCHPLDASHHMNGKKNGGGGDAEVDLSPSGAPQGALKALNPAGASYAPGNVVKTDSEGFRYTEGTCTNVYCHSKKVVEVPGPVPEPGVDFQFTGYPIQYPDYTVLERREYSSPAWSGTLSCDGCHGFPPRTYSPEWDLQDGSDDFPDVDGAAGDSHSWIDPEGYEDLHGYTHGFQPLACATCHYGTVTEQGQREFDQNTGWSVYQPVPIASHESHVNGKPDVAFTPDAITLRSDHDLSTASYDESTRTCSGVSCHINQADVAWGSPYRYENTFECNVCHRYKNPLPRRPDVAGR